MKYVISRHINGISLNDIEFLLDDKGDLIEFSSKKKAVDFLLENGFERDDIGYSVFIGTEKENDLVTL